MSNDFFNITFGAGLIVADFDGNGFADIYLPTLNEDLLYLNEGQRQFVLSSEWLPAVDEGFGKSVGGSTADFDGDGDFDLILLSAFGHNRLLENTGRNFVDITQEVGLSSEAGDSTAAVWFDFDLDNDLDLFVAGHKEDPYDLVENWPTATPNRIYQNTGSGFEPIDLLFEPLEAFTYAAAWIQPEMGKKPWLYNINDFGFEIIPNRLFKDFEDGYVAVGGTGLDMPMYGMGISQADMNYDGYPDFLVSDFEKVRLFMSDANLIWYESAYSLGLSVDTEIYRFAWGVNIFDFENDGDLDLYSGWGPVSNYGTGISSDDTLNQPHTFWLNHNEEFRMMTSTWEINNNAIARGSIVTDLDHDGLQDLIIKNLDAPVEIWWGNCMNGDWISLQIEQDSMNRYGVGAKITSISESGQRTKWVISGDSFASGGPPIVHFGLGTISEDFSDVIIELPTGEQYVQKLEKNLHHIVRLD